MQIIINNRPAFIKKGSSFQFVSENRHFTGSDSYTLSITFPLKDCPENLAIFGSINRCDVEKEQVKFDCTIVDRNFVRDGVITVTSISDAEVKTQFLEGRSVQNFDNSFDEVYINELDLGFYSPTVSDTPAYLTRGIDYGQMYVALPWVNNTSGNIQNQMLVDFDTEVWSWASGLKGLSFQPYLIYIIRQICMALGYSADLTDMENSNYRYLIICNALPNAWENRKWKSILPNWTVTEFFEQIGYLLGADFIIDHKGKSVRMEFVRKDIEALPQYCVENVVDAYSADVSQDNECTYIEQVNMKFADCGHQAWKAYSCDWFIRENRDRIKEFETAEDMCNYIVGIYETGGDWYSVPETKAMIDRIFHVREVNTYFIMRCNYCLKGSTSGRYWIQRYVLTAVNAFGERFKDRDENEKTIELKCVPVWIDNLEMDDNCIFLDVPEFDEELTDESYELTNDSNGWMPSGQQTITVNTLLQGEKEEHKEFFDKLYLGFWTGKTEFNMYMPHPTIDYITPYGEIMYDEMDMSLRLDGGGTKYPEKSVVYNVDSSVKFMFSFLADDIPAVRSVFHIKGQRYLCEKITATFTENGRSQLLKGVFYKIK